MLSKQIYRLALLAAIIIAIYAFFASGFGSELSFEALKTREAELRGYYATHPSETLLAYFLTYVVVTGLALPGAAVMTLAGGALFGLGVGTVMAVISATGGGILCFLASRFILRDFVRKHFQAKLQVVDEGLAKDGAFYLFSLRLIPIFPFFVVNLLMGLTPIRTRTFIWVSPIGMLPGTMVYVNAGTQLAKLDSLKGILSPGLLLSFALLAIFPFIARRASHFIYRLVLTYKGKMKHFPKPPRFDYDIVVIGAGSAGLVTSYIAAAAKAKVALIEKHKMGGDCLNTGCVPSKALIRTAKVLDTIRRAQDFGIRFAHANHDFAEIMERVQRVIKKIEPHDSTERYTSLGVECIEGSAFIHTPFEVEVNGRRLLTRNIVIATGARPFVPGIPGLEKIPHYTSDTIWNLRVKPQKLVVMGGGPIGCELAQAFVRLGVNVTLIERSSRLLASEDADVSEAIQNKLSKDGVRILLGHEVLSVASTSELLTRTLNGTEERISCDAVLLALGRRANVTGFGLENLGIGNTEKGTLQTDEYLRTIYPNILGCGDVVGPYQFTHMASHQAWFASVNALAQPFRKFKQDLRVVPRCTYTDPEVARVGLSETEANQAGLKFVVSKYGIDDLDRAICDEEAHGFVKVLTREGSDEILGATIVGHRAGDLIMEYVLAMKHGLGLGKILSTIHIYPTLAEANKYAAGVWRRKTAPEALLRWVEKFHAFRRG